jgi:solute carrier family 34 (sodium-dependent phosphate cotransporter)
MKAAQTLARRTSMPPAIRALVVVALIYVFLVGVSSLEAGINVMGAETQERLFSRVDNPMAGLFVGILGTVLVQSSSASTSVIVGLVASGALTVDQAVPMVMGANIGTTITNTLVSLGHVRQSNEFKRAFAAATVHDFFNVFAVAILLPLELATGVISGSAAWISETLVGSAGTTWESPVKRWVEQPVEWIQSLFEAITDDDKALGGLMVGVGLLLILASLVFITRNMKELVAERVERSMNAILGRGGGIMAIMVGLLITVAVQSSSITTSILIPMSAAGVISLRNAYPVTLGANVGTTVTALLAALAASTPEALTIGFVHTIFNVAGILILYGIPFCRELPIRAAETLADIAVARRSAAFAYVIVTFLVIPIVGLAILG